MSCVHVFFSCNRIHCLQIYKTMLYIFLPNLAHPKLSLEQPGRRGYWGGHDKHQGQKLGIQWPKVVVPQLSLRGFRSHSINVSVKQAFNKVVNSSNLHLRWGNYTGIGPMLMTTGHRLSDVVTAGTDSWYQDEGWGQGVRNKYGREYFCCGLMMTPFPCSLLST